MRKICDMVVNEGRVPRVRELSTLITIYELIHGSVGYIGTEAVRTVLEVTQRSVECGVDESISTAEV